ncbi:hypothetical protein [Hymenobacter glacialis]|uniref:Lipoprotein n=1 Tax=Hymenobacter glacialis TaxID=1908236 RepID=A0A1G1SYS2_9BACT|nr:hypothetical protein [Hymenobacter glacialis]OGX83773.1 hypothetical protein BEN48_03110 [Hymenobacter glacialis]
MKNSLLILAGAAALSLASCSQEKTTDTTVAAGDGMTTTTTTTTTTAMSEADMEARAQRIADRMVADMKITDEATKNKIRTVYVNRYRQMGDMQTKYATDTTGMAAAKRESMAVADAEFKTIFADPTQYQAYETGRMTYYNMADEDAAMSSGNMNSSSDMDMSDEGSKVKVKADGDIKIKDANGNVTKMDGDDGTIKMKDESGNKTKLK